MKFPSVEVEKRDRDDHTDALISSLLNEEKAHKKQKRVDTNADVGNTAAAPVGKGKTLAEIEDEEGGPVKESLVGMAQTKRALDRKKRDVEVGDTELVTNTERYEKDTLDVEQEDGITFEPFNLKQEREEGFFDDDGNYVLRKQGAEEGEEEQDAWLNSDEAKVVSDAIRRKIEAQRARAEEAARRGPLTDRQIAQRKSDMAAIMRPGETVARALKRLGAGGALAAGAAAGAVPRAMGKRERARLLAQQQQQQQQQAAAPPSAPAEAGAAGPEGTALELFTRLTELADQVLEEGELEIYGATTEELLRFARLWLPQLPVSAPAAAAAAPDAAAAGCAVNSAAADDDDMFADDDTEAAAAGGAGGVPSSAGAVAAVDEDQDMFADGEEGGGEGAGAGGGGTAGTAPAAAAAAVAAVAAPGPQEGADVSGAGPGPASAASGAAAAEGDAVDYGSWPIKELKRLLQERGVDPSGIVEKCDLVAKVKEVVAAGVAAGDAAGGGGEGAFVAPAGYVFDPSSGYFFCEESGMYYDTTTGGYCQVATGKWFYLDPSSGTFVEWKQG